MKAFGVLYSQNLSEEISVIVHLHWQALIVDKLWLQIEALFPAISLFKVKVCNVDVQFVQALSTRKSLSTDN